MKRLAILLFIFFSCSNVDEQSLIIDKIPDNPLLVLSIDNVNDIDYETINFISNSIDLDLDDINLLNPSDELTYSFHKSGKNKINGIIIQKSQDLNIDKKFIVDTINYSGLKIFKQKDFYISKIDQYLLISNDKLLIENVLRGATFNKNQNFIEFKKLHLSKTKNISLNVSENYKKVKFNRNDENISKYSNWIQYEFDLENDDINILGISERDKENRKINILQSLNKSKSEILNIIPNNFTFFKRMSFNKNVIDNNYNTFINNENVQEKKLDSIFFEVKEIGEVNINGESILIFDYENFNIEDYLKSFNQLTKYRGQTIYSGSNLNLSEFDVLDFKISKSFDYVTKINNFLILSNDLNVIQNLILNYNNRSLISKDENFIKFLEFIPNKTTYFEIVNNTDNEDNKGFPFWFSNYELKGNSNFKSLYTTPSFDLKKNKNLNLKFSKKLKNEIIVNPTFINNYKSGEKNIIFQDSNLNLILLGLNQEIVFEKKLDSKVISEIYQVDIYKNNRLQFVFLTEKEFIVLDIKGNYVKKITLKKSQSNKYLSVFDYDKNRNYRFVIQNGNTIKMLDSNFNNVRGFKRTKLKSEIEQKIKHIRISNKDYLVLVGKDGVPLILDRRGNIRIKLPKNLIIGQNNFYANSNSFVTINNLNQLIRIELNGKVSSKQLPDEKHLIYADENNLFIHSNGRILINNNEFKIPYGDFVGLNILGKKDKTYFHLRDKDNSQSYLFNKIGKLPSFPIFSASDLDVAVGVNQDFITTKGDEDEVLLYTIN